MSRMRALAALALCLTAVSLASACAPQPRGAAGAEPEPGRAAIVSRWLIVTSGDEPASCDERLATEGVGLKEDALGIPFEVIHLDESKSFALASLSYAVDGRCAFSWTRDPEADGSPNQLNIARGDLAPGAHQVAFVASFEPARRGDYDVRYELQSGYAIDLDSAVRLFITSYERAQSPAMDRRLAVRFELGDLHPTPTIIRDRR
jgi:hypothetical protein